MKRICCVVLMLLVLVGCGPENTMSPLDALVTEQSVQLFWHDGEAVSSVYLFDLDDGEAFLDGLREVPVQRVEAPEVLFPMYGIEGKKVDGTKFYLAFAGGCCLTEDGLWYAFDYDFASALEQAAWEAGPGVASFPCAALWMAEGEELHEVRWRAERMLPAEVQEIVPPSGLTAELVNYLGENVTVKYTNHTGAIWYYGLGFRLEVELDGVWYPAPYAISDYGPSVFSLVSYGLPDGQSVERTYNLASYGHPLTPFALPNGHYRIVTDVAAIEFDA